MQLQAGEPLYQIMLARYYEAGLGRFLSVDPVDGGPSNTQSWNRYSYVGNNPITNTDPTGQCIDAADCMADAGEQGLRESILEGSPSIRQQALSGSNTELAIGFGVAAAAALPELASAALGAFIRNAPQITAIAQDIVAGATDNPSPGAAAVVEEGGAAGGRAAKTVEQMASDLKGQIGKNTVSTTTSGAKVNIDLAGASHGVPTPHVQTQSINVGLNGKINLGTKVTRAATKADIRTAGTIVQKRKPNN